MLHALSRVAPDAQTKAITIRLSTPRFDAAGNVHSAVMKRFREDGEGVEHPAKVRRVVRTDRLSKLSDELLVRILSFLPVSSLLTSQR